MIATNKNSLKTTLIYSKKRALAHKDMWETEAAFISGVQ
jgi:hypothetical protein